jgi:hypothetical protein
LQQDGFVTYDEESAYFALTAQVRLTSDDQGRRWSFVVQDAMARRDPSTV